MTDLNITCPYNVPTRDTKRHNMIDNNAMYVRQVLLLCIQSAKTVVLTFPYR